jgi:hypothetical protein
MSKDVGNEEVKSRSKEGQLEGDSTVTWLV